MVAPPVENILLAVLVLLIIMVAAATFLPSCFLIVSVSVGVSVGVIGVGVAAALSSEPGSQRGRFGGRARNSDGRARNSDDLAKESDDLAKNSKTNQHDYYTGENLTADEQNAIKKVSHVADMSELVSLVSKLPSELPYHYRMYGRRVATHIGQRKLLMSEVDFLTDYARAGDTVVYAGAAPGHHIPFLVSLFENKRLKFELYDPREFELPKWDKRIIGGITTHRGLFTDDTARSYSGRDDVLFVSDIRTGGHEFGLPTEEDVKRDMIMQEKWVLAMQPRACMLKFRLEYDKAGIREFEYIEGELRIQAWAPPSSSETRLIAVRGADGYKRCMYDQQRYDNQMFYNNSIIREWGAFDHGVPLRRVRGLDTCYDCALEAYMWKKYLGDAATPNKIADLFNDGTRALHRSLLRPPHGLYPEEPMYDKRNAILKFAKKRSFTMNEPMGEPMGEPTEGDQ